MQHSEKRDSNDEESQEKKVFAIPISILLIMICLWILCAYFAAGKIDIPFPSVPAKDRGTFGDTFGWVNSLFQGLTLFYVAYTVSLQTVELRLQRKELRNSIEEQKGQREQFQIQNAEIRQQNFETGFGRILDNLLIVRNSIHYQVGGMIKRSGVFDQQTVSQAVDLYGLEALEKIALQLKREIEQRAVEYANKFPDEPAIKILRISYEAIYTQYGHQVGHYFRLLYNLFKMSEKAEDKVHAKYMIHMVRAQLSSYELLMLFGNCLTPRGNKSLPYVVRFNILKHLDKDLLPRSIQPLLDSEYKWRPPQY